MQEQLVTSVLALGKPTVLVLVHGGAMSLGPIKDSAHAIVDCFCTSQPTLLPCHPFIHLRKFSSFWSF